MRTPAMLAAALLLTACGGGHQAAAVTPTPTPSAFTVLGQLDVRAEIGVDDVMNCVLRGGRTDITAGAQVTITDGSGATVALGSLGAPHRDSGGYTCQFDINIGDVPRGRGFYGVEVAHRGVVRYSETDIVTKPVQLKL